MNLPSPIFMLINQYARTRELYSPDIDMTRETLVSDIASGELSPPYEIFEWRPDEQIEPIKITADIAKEVSVHLWVNERGCKGDLRDWIDENCGASEADKINAHAGVLEAV